MTQEQIDIMEIKATLRQIQNHIEMIDKHCKERSYNCMDLVPSTQAFNNEKLYDRE